MSDIFLSYANADRERVRPLAQSLEARGWSVFWDRKIPIGKTWDQVIEREIDSVQAIVVLWSAASTQSDWVKTEAREGKARGILIPALIEQTRPPLEFRQLQTANLIGWTAGSAHPEFDEFVSGLASLLRKSPAPEAYPSEMRTPVEPAREAGQSEQRPQPESPTAEKEPTRSEAAQTVEGAPEQAEQRPQPEPPTAEADATHSETAQTVEGAPEQADQQSQVEVLAAKRDASEALADRQVELAKLEVARSWKIVLACITVLALPTKDILGKLWDIREVTERRTEVTDVNNENFEEKSKTKTNKLPKMQRVAQEGAQKRLDAALSDILYVKFPIPGIETSISVETRFAPLVWASSAFLTLLLMHILRRRIYRFLARSARIHIVELKRGGGDLVNHVFDLPWWLHPLPKRDGKCVPATTFSLFCGLQASKAARLAPVGLVFVVALAVLFMCFLSSWAAGLYPDESSELAYLVQAVSFVPFAAVLCVAFSWFSQQAVDDAFENETSHNNSRRQFAIWTVGIMAAAVVAPFVFSHGTALASGFKRSVHLQERKPRFRRKKPRRYEDVTIAPGFYENSHTGTIHYVLLDGTTSRLHVSGSINIELLRSIAMEEVFSNVPISMTMNDNQKRMNLRRASFFFEQASLAEIENDNYDQACKLLLEGIRYDIRRLRSAGGVSATSRPCYRLADLLAGITLRYKKDNAFNELRKLVGSYPNASVWKARVDSWSTPNNRFRRRWENFEKPIKWGRSFKNGVSLLK